MHSLNMIGIHTAQRYDDPLVCLIMLIQPCIQT